MNVATGVTTKVTTNSDGYYSAPNLLPGEYEIAVSAKGFDTEARKGISLTVGAQQVFNLTLHVGSAEKTVVVVTSEAPAVQLASSDISAVVNATTVRELPLNGRSWTDLAALQPGVNTIVTQPTFSVGPDRGNRGFGQQLTISGARPQQNNYRLDGVSLNDYANGAPGSVLGGNLGVDAIQEFSVLTSNYSAEYGKTSGGVVNAITRQGTNGFHGSVYEFLRNSALDARNFFEDPTLPKAAFKRNQFGGAIGGPIIKNRTFFFADYEGIRQSKGIPNVSNVPSQAAWGGTLCSIPIAPPDPNACSPTPISVDTNVLKYMPLYHLPNGPLSANGDTGTFTFAGQQIINENFFTGRIDQKFSDKDTLFGTYLYDKTPYTSPDAFGNVLLGSKSSRRVVAVEETHSFTPIFVNAVRFGYNHEAVINNQSLSALNTHASDLALGAFVDASGTSTRPAANVGVSGLAALPGGMGASPTYYYYWDSFQLYDDAFVSKGKHSIKFGGAFERMKFQATALTDPNGIWHFGSLKEFLTNDTTNSTFQGGIAASLTPRNFRQNIFGVYVQDDWRSKPNLTLNLGLRYEMSSVPTETNGKLVNLRHITDQFPVCGVVVAGCPSVGPLFNNPTLKNFEPRIGFAWDPLRNGKMAVRGGIGLFDVLPLPYQILLLETQAVPFFQYPVLDTTSTTPVTCPTFSFYKIQPCLINPSSLRSAYIETNAKRNYVTQWNLNVQYQLTPNLAAMVAYVGSRGIHQPFRVDEANLVLPTKTSDGFTLWPNPLGSGKKVNTNFGSIRGMFYEGMSYYNAMELQLSKRMSHGFQVQGNYTWSKSIDTSSATLAGDAFGNSISSLNYFDLKLTRGLSDFNVGRTLIVNGTWEVPTPKSLSGAARWATGGWQLGMIFTVSDGVPFTATWGTGSNPAGENSSDSFGYPNRLGGPGCQTLTNPGNPSNYIKTQCFTVPTAPSLAFFTAQCDPSIGSTNPTDPNYLWCPNLRGNAGRNILIGPGITNLDFSVFKNNYIKRISENFNVQFRMEIFNIMNHPNFAPPSTTADGNTDIFDAGGNSQSPANGGITGVLLRTTIPERQIQFALKVIF